MKKFILLIVLCFLMIQPIVKADGMPYPYIRPQIREEHQIVLMEVKDGEILTTLDLGIRNRPETVFSILDSSIYISQSNPFWLKTFLLPFDFKPKDLCINSNSFSYYYEDESPVKLTINGNVVYLYVPKKCTNDGQCSRTCSKLCPPNSYSCCVDGNLGKCNSVTGQCYCSYNANLCKGCPSCGPAEYCDGYSKTCKPAFEIIPTGEVSRIVIPRPIDTKQIYCKFMKNDDLTNPQFIDVSTYFNPGEYNTIEIRSNLPKKSFSINKIYLASETTDTVKIIIPYKTMPKSVEVGGSGLSTWELDRPFKKEPEYWYGYYGGRLLTAEEAPKLAGIAQTVETSVKSQVTQTQVATDVTGGFEGKVSNIVSTASLSKPSSPSKGTVLRFAGEVGSVYEAYMGDYGYVIELKILPYELKRITVKWIEDITNEDRFGYYYPLGTGRTWFDNISYTAIYVKLPNKYTINYASIPGREKAEDASYYYFRWKFVESSPSEDLTIDVKKISETERFFLSTYIPIIGLVVFILIIFMLSHTRR